MKEFYKKILKILFVFIASINSASSEEVVKIGLLVPLSGESSYIGQSIIQSVRLGINKINNDRLLVLPRDTKSDPSTTLKIVDELYSEGTKIFIGPVFNKNLKELDKFQDATFLSFTNKVLGNPNNVISSGINAKSQFDAIKKYLEMNDLDGTLVLIPKKSFKEEVEEAIIKSRLKTKKIFYYDAEPTKLTKQIEKVTRYKIRKRNLEDEIKRVENSDEDNKERKLEILNKKDTLGRIGYDSIIIADFNESLKSVTTSLLYTDVSPKKVAFISLNQWFDESLLKENTLHPIYFPSINKKNYELFMDDFKNTYGVDADQLSFLSYDLIGLVYFLIYENGFKISKKIFYKKNKFKGKIGIFEISKNTITHQLNFYSIEDKKFKKIF